MIKLQKDFLIGSIPPLITPFKGGKVDFDTLGRMVENHVKQGSHGVLITGTTSEPSTLTVEERIRCYQVAVDAAKNKVPVVAATGSQSHAESIALQEGAEKAGADALLVVTPYYIRPPQRGLVAYYTDLGKRTKLPMMIYHIPGRTAVNVTVETIAEIMDQVPHLVGVKHAVNDLEFVTKCIARFGAEFRIFVGLEELSFPMMCVGACGLMNAVGNLLPKKVAKLADLVLEGKLEAAKKLHYELFEINQAIFFDTNPIPLKYMMKRTGLIPDNTHRLPMVPADKKLEERLDGVLKRAGLLKAAAA
jgi:4-hydroxy-tetrahydrodipicolinate synthase